MPAFQGRGKHRGCGRVWRGYHGIVGEDLGECPGGADRRQSSVSVIRHDGIHRVFDRDHVLAGRRWSVSARDDLQAVVGVAD